MRVRGEKSENKWRRGGGRRPGRGEARCKGGGKREDDASWRRSGRTIPRQDLRRRRRRQQQHPEGEGCFGGSAQPRLGPHGLLFSGAINYREKSERKSPKFSRRVRDDVNSERSQPEIPAERKMRLSGGIEPV